MPTQTYKILGQAVVGSTRTFNSITNKAITTNVATLTTGTAHGFAVGDIVVVSGVDTTFDGTQVVASVPLTTTFTFRSATATVASTAVSPAATVIRTHNLGGVASANIYSTGVNAIVSTGSAHGLSANDWAYVTCGNANIDGLVKVISAPSTTTLTYAKGGTAVASTAVTSGAVGRAIPTSWTEVYTVPVSTSAVLSTVAVTNQTTNNASYRLACSSGATPAQNEILFFDGLVSAGDTITLTLGITLQAGKRITDIANSPEIGFTVFGVENT